MAQKTAVHPANGPKAGGPYSPGIIAGNMVFVAGQVGIDPAIGKLVEGEVEEQTAQVLKNVRTVLEAAGCTMDDVVKTTVFLRDMNDFAKMNAVYATFFGDVPPARSTVQVARLPMDVAVEIEAIAIKG
jgi:2-iminobutanoate/2-iminopropanoate deaminase